MGTRSGYAFETCSVKKKAGRKRETKSTRDSRFCSCLFLFAFLTCFGGNLLAQDLDSLARSIQTGNSEQKRDALFQLRNLRTETASRIALPALSDKDPIVRATASASVTFLPKVEAVNALQPLLADKQAFVRKEAAYALGNVESPDAAKPLIEHFVRERDIEVKAAIAIGLGQTGNPTAVEPLGQILKQTATEDTEFVRRSAARSIGQIAQIIKTSGSYVVTPENFLPDKFKSLTGDDLTSRLPTFGAAVVTLSQVLQNKSESDDTRRESAYSLGAIGSRSAVAVLHANQNGSDPYLAQIATEALLRINVNSPN